MIYCSRGIQEEKVLDTADVYNIAPSNINLIPDLFHQYPDKDIIVRCGGQHNPFTVVEECRKFKGASSGSGRIVFGTFSLSSAMKLSQKGHAIMLLTPIDTIHDLHYITSKVDLSYARLSGQLLFNIEGVKKIWQSAESNVIYSINPSAARTTDRERLLSTDVTTGGFIRPEDLHIYDETGVPFMFEIFNDDDVTLVAEKQILRIYQSCSWNGDLRDIVTGLREHPARIDNRAIPEPFGEMRSKCQQKCLVSSSCHYCTTAFRFNSAVQDLHSRTKQVN